MESLSDISRVLITFLNLHIAVCILLKLVIDRIEIKPGPLLAMRRVVQRTFHQGKIKYGENGGTQHN